MQRAMQSLALQSGPTAASRQCKASCSVSASGLRNSVPAGSKQLAMPASRRSSTGQRGRLTVVAAVKKSSARSIVCSKTLVALPGEEDRVLAMCQEVAAFSQEAMKERSKGIIEYNCSQVRLQWTCSSCSGGPPSRHAPA